MEQPAKRAFSISAPYRMARQVLVYSTPIVCSYLLEDSFFFKSSFIFCIDIISTHSPFVLLLVDQADKDYVHKYNQLLLKEEDNEYFLHL